MVSKMIFVKINFLSPGGQQSVRYPRLNFMKVAIKLFCYNWQVYIMKGRKRFCKVIKGHLRIIGLGNIISKHSRKRSIKTTNRIFGVVSRGDSFRTCNCFTKN